MKSKVRALTLMATAATATFAAQAPQPDAAAPVLERVGKFAEQFYADFAGVVSEEHQVQRLFKSDGRVDKTRRLESDLLLIKNETGGLQMFRDTIKVDDKAVRNRDERLRKLFIETKRTAAEQAAKIHEESRRHNLGDARNGISPLLPFVYLHPKRVKCCQFTLTGSSLAFEETQPTTFMAAVNNGKRAEMPVRGTVEIEPETGRLRVAELTADTVGTGRRATFLITYQEHPGLKLTVPIAMREKYWNPTKPKEENIEVESTFTNFRRFTVSTSETIKKD